jgi:hypothetical protein
MAISDKQELEEFSKLLKKYELTDTDKDWIKHLIKHGLEDKLFSWICTKIAGAVLLEKRNN